MCSRCDYRLLLKTGGLEPTPNRVRVLEAIGGNSAPVSAQAIFTIVSRSRDINRVTVYRILDLLVGKGLVERLSGGGRSQVYGLAASEHHPAHPHFRCRCCGALQCLQPGSLKLDLGGFEPSVDGEILAVEVRVDGICISCLKKA